MSITNMKRPRVDTWESENEHKKQRIEHLRLCVCSKCKKQDEVIEISDDSDDSDDSSRYNEDEDGDDDKYSDSEEDDEEDEDDEDVEDDEEPVIPGLTTTMMRIVDPRALHEYQFISARRFITGVHFRSKTGKRDLHTKVSPFREDDDFITTRRTTKDCNLKYNDFFVTRYYTLYEVPQLSPVSLTDEQRKRIAM